MSQNSPDWLYVLISQSPLENTQAIHRQNHDLLSIENPDSGQQSVFEDTPDDPVVLLKIHHVLYIRISDRQHHLMTLKIGD